MSTRRGQRYSTSYKKKEYPNQDPYAMRKAPKGVAWCRTCRVIYAKKRWYFDPDEARTLAATPGSQGIICPACQKIRDQYPEGIVTLTWADLPAHDADIRGLITHVESRLMLVNPLDRVMKSTRRRTNLEVQTTTDRLAQRIGRELVKAFKGHVTYHWAHRDMLIRVDWRGPDAAEKTKRAARR
ncbi:hypothetical protein YTPLAS18_36850 [Nitrospira sp.]|nr:hypothetical protein YTPLAS18_36850 [Nitrospira sp.]